MATVRTATSMRCLWRASHRGNLMIVDLLLALGVLLSTATQLRLADTPFGPGEMCLAIWLGVVLCLQVGRAAPASNAALNRVVTFWLMLIVAECVGAIVGFATEPFFDRQFVHDVIAYSLLMCVACTMALELANEYRRRRVTWLIVLLGAASLSLQVAQAFGLIPLPIPADPWEWDRLRGWSHDPNQLGLAAALLTLISIHVAETARARVKIITAAACAMLAFSVGVLTKSDSFSLGLLAAGAAFLAIKSSLWLATFKRGLSFRAALVSLALLGLPVLAAGALPLAPAAVEFLQAKSEALYQEDNQGDLRFHLWAEAFDKGMDAAMLGLGPGPHLTRTKSWKFSPPTKFEAHNTPLDLFAQGGLLAVLALALLYASLLLATAKAKLPALVALSCAILVFSMFHFIIRHPIFWFGVVLCLLEAASVSKLSFGGKYADVAQP
jgi:O-antigen ligase